MDKALSGELSYTQTGFVFVFFFTGGEREGAIPIKLKKRSGQK